MPAPRVAPGQLSSKARAGETNGGFIPQPHLTHRLLMIHLFTTQSFCSAGGTSCRVRAGRRKQGLPPLLLIEAFPAGDSQAAFQVPEQPTSLFHLLQSAGKLIPIVCPRPDILLMNHSHYRSKGPVEGVCTMQNSLHLSLLLNCQGLRDSWLVLRKGLC